jgi:hypothetical protein
LCLHQAFTKPLVASSRPFPSSFVVLSRGDGPPLLPLVLAAVGVVALGWPVRRRRGGGLLLILAAFANWESGLLRNAWVVGASAVVLAALGLGIARFYSSNYGRLTPSPRQQTRVVGAAVVGAALMVGASLLARSRADWSLDLPVNPTAGFFALFMLGYGAVTVGLRRHQAIVWGAVAVTGLLPVWSSLSLAGASNAGLVLVGVAAMVTGILDHRLLVRTFASASA